MYPCWIFIMGPSCWFRRVIPGSPKNCQWLEIPGVILRVFGIPALLMSNVSQVCPLSAFLGKVSPEVPKLKWPKSDKDLIMTPQMCLGSPENTCPKNHGISSHWWFWRFLWTLPKNNRFFCPSIVQCFLGWLLLPFRWIRGNFVRFVLVVSAFFCWSVEVCVFFLGGGGMAGEVDFFFGKTWGSKSWISCCPSYQFMRVKLPFVSNWYQNSALVVVDFKSPTCQRKRDRLWNWGWKMPGVDFGVGKLLFFFGGGLNLKWNWTQG